MFTNKDYPIQKYWLIKPFVIVALFALLFHILTAINQGLPLMALSRNDFYMLFAVVVFLCLPLFGVLSIKFSLEDDAMVIQQGVLNLKRGNFLYSKIQDVSIEQGFIDRLLGLYTIYIENAAANNRVRRSLYTNFLIGLADNRVSIPGLKEKDALALKEALLNRIGKFKNPL